MLRKIIIAVAAVAALGAVSLAPASAKGFGGGFHGGHFHGGHFHGGGFRVYSGVGIYDDCYRNVLVTKRNGDVVVRTVNVCI
jgi:hypothetical protein